MKLARRTFLLSSAGLVAAALASRGLAQNRPSKIPPKPPALPGEKIQAVVVASHRSLEAVMQLVEGTPLLVNASWDWGGGDFETPLQATAHTGQREIAEYLLAQGARPDLHAAAMLGQLAAIQSAIAADPKAHEIHGPHGFTLLHCARAGGAKAKPVYDWLVAQGVPETFQRPLPYIWPAGTAPGEPK